MNNFSKKRNELINLIFYDHSSSFEEKALALWAFQYQYNDIYRKYCDFVLRGFIPQKVESIPFLPISFFKSQPVITGIEKIQLYFESSGTSATLKSRHLVSDINLYENSFLRTFSEHFGNVEDICILALLPSYQEQGNSSLVYMVKKLIDISKVQGSGFYLNENARLANKLKQNEMARIPTILIGVTYALLDFFEVFNLLLSQTIVMETGGMKGRKKELLRKEVHDIIKKETGLKTVHSEYGMTELFSQAYAFKDGIFKPSSFMKVLLRPQDDPLLSENPTKKNEVINGIINVIDLANVDSCSFIATDDAGILYENGTFEVTGRYDNSEARGCSLMII